MGKLSGKVAIISGGAQGQGAAEARCFAAEGAAVFLGDVLDEAGEAVAAEIRGAGDDATYVHLDVSREADWRAAFKLAAEQSGGVDILINNAAVLIPRAPIEEIKEEDWDKVMGVNAKGVFLGTKAAIPTMRARGGGSIVNISSIAGIGQSTHQEPAYATSKGAIRIFSKVTAAQHASDNIRCNSVHPGPVDTEMFRNAFADPDALTKRLARVPMRRMGTIDEIVVSVLFLASDDSAYITGTELVIDGGALCM